MFFRFAPQRLYEDDEGQTESEGDETESSAKPEAGRKTPPTLKKIQRSALEKDAKQEIPERNDNKTSTETGDLLGLDSKSAKSQKDDAVNLLELSSNTGNADLKPIAADGERSVEKGQGENKQATQAVSSPFDHIKELDQLRQGKGLGEMERYDYVFCSFLLRPQNARLRVGDRNFLLTFCGLCEV